MSDSSTILTTDGIPLQERVIVKAHSWCCLICGYFFPLLIYGVSLAIDSFILFISSLVIAVFLTVSVCSTRIETEVIINNSNRIILLISRNVNLYFCSRQKIIDMTKIVKLNSYEEHIEKKYESKGKTETIVENYTHCILYYKDGTNEDISYFFDDLDNESLKKCNNLLGKYIVMDYINPKMEPTVEMNGTGGYPVSTPGADNSNIMPNQINNDVAQPYYNPGIPPNYNPNVQQNYNSGMGQNTPENYSGNGNIYVTPEYNMDCLIPKDSNNEKDEK